MAMPESMASDPATAPDALAGLAYERPDLQPLIAQNPAAYDGLIDWILQYGTPAGIASAKERLRAKATEVPPVTVEPLIQSTSAAQISEQATELLAAVETPSGESDNEQQARDDATRVSTSAARQEGSVATGLTAAASPTFAPEAEAPGQATDPDPTVRRDRTAGAAKPSNFSEDTVLATSLPKFTPGMDAGTFPGDTQTLPPPTPITARPPAAYPRQPTTPVPAPGQTQQWSQQNSATRREPIIPPTPGMPRPGQQPAPRVPQSAVGPSVARSTAQARTSTDKSWPVVVLGVLIGLLAALLIGAVTWFFFLRDDGASSTTSETQTMAEADAEAAKARLAEEEAAEAERLAAQREREEEAAQAPAEEDKPLSKEVRFPAPTNAVSTTWLMAPSTNIACQLDAASVKCSIYAANFDLSAPGCTSKPYTVVADMDGTRWDCTLPPVPNTGATTLPYGSYGASGDVACLSTSNGMSCWDTVSGHSFAIARQGFVIGTNGSIPQADFPWG